MKKMISFGADGASVNMGHRGGVIALLQREAGEYIIPIHCMPHRFVTGKNGYVVADIHAHLSHACVHTQPKLFVSHTQIGTQTHHCNRVGKKRRGRWIVIFIYNKIG